MEKHAKPKMERVRCLQLIEETIRAIQWQAERNERENVASYQRRLESLRSLLSRY